MPNPSILSEIDWLLHERTAWSAGFETVAGIDEAGRGALAGPVIAACVVLPSNCVPPGVNDSKKLSIAEREACFEQVLQIAFGYGIGCISAERIDTINILRATHEAMRLALRLLPAGLEPDLVLIDGLPVLPFPTPQRAIVCGDGLSASIAAASILAKVTRDRLMVDLDLEFPHYGFASHKGYGTPQHIEALRVHGLCPLHRRSFRPKALIETNQDAASEQCNLDFEDHPQSI